MTADGQGSHHDLAEKLRHLYTTLRRADGGQYTDRDVATGIRAGGGDISASYLNMLRTGKKTNPTMQHLESIACFFGVPVSYFFDDAVAARVKADLTRLTELRGLKEALDDPEVRVVAMKARGLSPAGLRRLADIIDLIQEVETGGVQQREPGGSGHP